MSLDNVRHLTIGGKSAVRLEIEGIAWKGLPAGYKRLDYIETNGTQYIDTGFTPNQDSRIVCEIMWMGGMNGFGARSTVASRNFSARVINDYWQLGYGSDGGVVTGTIKAERDWTTVEINKNSLYVGGEFSVSREYDADFTAPYPIALGAIRAGSLYYGDGRYRACQIYDNGVLVRDFIPCQSPDGKAGMYDTLNAKFYGNAGTGEIIAGSEV